MTTTTPTPEPRDGTPAHPESAPPVGFTEPHLCLPVWLTGLADLTELAHKTVERANRELSASQRRSGEFVEQANLVRGVVDAIVRDMRRIDKLLPGYQSPAGQDCRLDEVLAALRPLAAVADWYDDDALDEARPSRGDNHRGPETIELLTTSGGRALLTLADAFRARTALARAGGAA